MDRIDLDAIIDSQSGGVMYAANPVIYLDIRKCMKEAIRQALVLATEKAKVSEVYQDGRKEPYTGLSEVRIFNPNGPDSIVVPDKQSILDVEKLILG